jgi:hypothetical protein
VVVGCTRFESGNAGIELAPNGAMQILSHSKILLLSILLAGLATACVDEPELATETQALASAKVRLHGVVLGEFPGQLCFSLEGTTFVPDPFTGTGTTIETSNCTWNASIQQCECDVVIRRQ